VEDYADWILLSVQSDPQITKIIRRLRRFHRLNPLIKKAGPMMTLLLGNMGF
jgi:hypothetical protein